MTRRAKGIIAVAVILAVAAFLSQGYAKEVKQTKHVKKAKKEAKMIWRLSSEAISEGKRIPDKYTCKGPDVSPALKWDPAPAGTAELVLIMDDPDAPVGLWTHWTIYGMSPDRTSLPENVEKTAEAKSVGALQGITSFRKPGYGGPCPPPGPTHRYFFKLYALDTKTNLPASASLKQVEDAIKGHIIAEARLMGTYSR